MQLLESVGQLIGVLVGALLTGATAVLRARIERKRLIGRALSDLLEIRHQVVGMDLILSDVRQRFQLSNEALPPLRGVFESILPDETEAHKRYDDAVSLLAGADPVFSFYLRSKNAIPRILSSLRDVAMQGGASPADIEIVEQKLSSMVIPVINEAAIALGRQHSIYTWWRVRKLIRESNTLPPEVTSLFEQAQAIAVTDAGKANAAG